jgi:hypothetical protein
MFPAEKKEHDWLAIKLETIGMRAAETKSLIKRWQETSDAVDGKTT